MGKVESARAEKPELSFGYLYDFRNPAQWHRPWSDVYAETLDIVAWSESAGFGGAWVPEHHGADDGYLPSPNLALAAIAARTSSIRIGAALAIAPLYHPVRFAEECAVLDILSHGRLETALGIGYRRREYDMHGERFGQRGRRFDEFLHIVRALWAGETVTFAGQHYAVTNARIVPPPTRGTIPLYIGGFTEPALARAAQYADGLLGNEEVFDLYAAKLVERGKDAAQATIRVPGLFLTVAEDPDRALDELAPYYHHVYSCYAGWMTEDNAIGMENPTTQAMDVDTFKQSGILQVLTPEQAVAHFKAMQERGRVDPQIVVGLLVDRCGFPLEIGCFEGNKAETLTIVPIVKAFQARHDITDMVVVADAGMLSAGNLRDLDDAGLRFIVGSRVTKAPNDLASHFHWHGTVFTDGQIIDTITPRVQRGTAKSGAAAKASDPKVKAEPIWNPQTHMKSWRAVWAYSTKRRCAITRR